MTIMRAVLFLVWAVVCAGAQMIWPRISPLSPAVIYSPMPMTAPLIQNNGRLALLQPQQDVPHIPAANNPPTNVHATSLARLPLGQKYNTAPRHQDQLGYQRAAYQANQGSSPSISQGIAAQYPPFTSESVVGQPTTYRLTGGYRQPVGKSNAFKALLPSITDRTLLGGNRNARQFAPAMQQSRIVGLPVRGLPSSQRQIPFGSAANLQPVAFNRGNDFLDNWADRVESPKSSHANPSRLEQNYRAANRVSNISSRYDPASSQVTVKAIDSSEQSLESPARNSERRRLLSERFQPNAAYSRRAFHPRTEATQPQRWHGAVDTARQDQRYPMQQQASASVMVASPSYARSQFHQMPAHDIGHEMSHSQPAEQPRLAAVEQYTAAPAYTPLVWATLVPQFAHVIPRVIV